VIVAYKYFSVISFVVLLFAVSACNNGGGGSASGNGGNSGNVDVQEFTVTGVASAGGSITPENSDVMEGETINFKVVPDIGFRVESVTGCDGTLNGDVYTTGPITVDCTVNASFVLLTYSVSAIVGPNGSVTPTIVFVDHGSTTNLTVTPDTGYNIANVSGCNGTLSGSIFTTGEITENCTINVSFSPQIYTISTIIGAGGSITPPEQLVDYGNTANFTINPDPGYVVDTVSGCSGSLVDDTYTTGITTEDCTVTVTFVTGIPPVAPHFESNGIDWNDYVQGNSIDTVVDIACSANVDIACLHAGEVREIITDQDSCNGLTASDNLEVFIWVCDDSSGTARFISTGFVESKYLSDLLDFSVPRWKPNAVAIYANGVLIRKTPLTTWWSNPVIDAGDGSTPLDTEKTIYTVNGLINLSSNYVITASKAALVMSPGSAIRGRPNGTNVIGVDGVNFVWIEGIVDGTNSSAGIHLSNVNFSRLLNVSANFARGSGIILASSSHNFATDVFASSNNAGLYVYNNSNFNVFSNVKVINNGTYGVTLSSNISNNSFAEVAALNNPTGFSINSVSYLNIDGLTVSNSADSGIDLHLAESSTISNVNASNNAIYGLWLSGLTNSNVSNIKVSNSNYGVSVIQSNDSTFTDMIASNNDLYGIYILRSSNNFMFNMTSVSNSSGVYLNIDSYSNVLSGVTAANNSEYGIYLFGASSNTFIDVTLLNNFDGLYLTNNTTSWHSNYNTFLDVTSSNNANYGIRLESPYYNTFFGIMQLGNNGIDCSVLGGVDPGINPDCSPQGSSDFNYYVGTAENSFVGKITSDDSTNTSDSDGAANYPLESTNFDWFSFQNPFRSWGKDGSTFPNADHQGIWTEGSGRIWDWSLVATDTMLRDSSTIPSSNDVLTHTWDGTPDTNDNAGCDAIYAGSVWNDIDSACESTFLRHSFELIGDGSGNDNGLCESNETCLYTPNMGSYQGHGELIQAGSIGTGGTIENVILMRYESNGY